MAGCDIGFSISDGTLQVDVPLAALHDDYRIERVLLEEGVDTFRAANGNAVRHFRFEAFEYTVRGAGIADPNLWALDLMVPSWTVTIPGFANGSAPVVWTVLPTRPRQVRHRRGHEWTLQLESA